MTMILDDLDPQHRTLIEQSAIAPEVARVRGYRTVRTKAELRRLGFADSQCRVPALLVPVYDVRGEIATYQIRPDAPRIGKNGKPIKYETVAGGRMVLDVPPGIRDKLADPAWPLFITEGARKADAAVSKGLVCIDVIGVFGWRGTNVHGGKVALPDLEWIALNNRIVYFTFDSDIMEKRPVYEALRRLREVLA